MFEKTQKDFDPSYQAIQCRLWAKLTPEQQEYVQPVFRKLKNHVQVGLSKALLSYMEDGYVSKFTDVPTATLFLYLTGHGLDKKEPGMVTFAGAKEGSSFDFAQEPGSRSFKGSKSSKEPERIVDIIDRVFGSFRSINHKS